VRRGDEHRGWKIVIGVTLDVQSRWRGRAVISRTDDLFAETMSISPDVSFDSEDAAREYVTRLARAWVDQHLEGGSVLG